MLRRCTISVAFIFLALAQHAGAREWSAGLVSSPSGCGILAQSFNSRGNEIDILSITTDFYGLLSGRTDDLGIRFGYTHDYIITQYEGNGFSMKLHAGAGMLTGYVHDHENGLFIGAGRPLEKEMGIVAALSCSFGLRFDFFRRVALDLGFSANPGVHLRMDRENGSMYLAFYKNGIYQIMFPRISIMYRF